MFRRIARFLRNTFAAGLLVFVPVAFTIWLVTVVGGWVDRPLRALFRTPGPDDKGLAAAISRLLRQLAGDALEVLDKPGLGFLVLLVALFVLGIFARTFLGRWLVGLGEAIVKRLPIIRTIYLSIKQMLEAILAAGRQEFRNVVLVEFPQRGVYGIGFVTGPGRGEIKDRLGAEFLSVFYPTTPNPTSGFLLLVPRDRLVFLDMSVEDAAKTIMSGGIAMPEGKRLPVANAALGAAAVFSGFELGKSAPSVQPGTGGSAAASSGCGAQVPELRGGSADAENRGKG